MKQKDLEGRKVKVYKMERCPEKDPGPQYKRVLDYTGTFLRFGEGYEEFEGGPGNYAAGVILLSNGRIECPNIEMVEFDEIETMQPDDELPKSGIRWEIDLNQNDECSNCPFAERHPPFMCRVKHRMDMAQRYPCPLLTRSVLVIKKDE